MIFSKELTFSPGYIFIDNKAIGYCKSVVVKEQQNYSEIFSVGNNSSILRVKGITQYIFTIYDTKLDNKYYSNTITIFGEIFKQDYKKFRPMLTGCYLHHIQSEAYIQGQAESFSYQEILSKDELMIKDIIE
jgi:hypothetical protein